MSMALRTHVPIFKVQLTCPQTDLEGNFRMRFGRKGVFFSYLELRRCLWALVSP